MVDRSSVLLRPNISPKLACSAPKTSARICRKFCEFGPETQVWLRALGTEKQRWLNSAEPRLSHHKKRRHEVIYTTPRRYCSDKNTLVSDESLEHLPLKDLVTSLSAKIEDLTGFSPAIEKAYPSSGVQASKIGSGMGGSFINSFQGQNLGATAQRSGLDFDMFQTIVAALANGVAGPTQKVTVPSAGDPDRSTQVNKHKSAKRRRCGGAEKIEKPQSCLSASGEKTDPSPVQLDQSKPGQPALPEGTHKKLISALSICFPHLNEASLGGSAIDSRLDLLAGVALCN